MIRLIDPLVCFSYVYVNSALAQIRGLAFGCGPARLFSGGQNPLKIVPANVFFAEYSPNHPRLIPPRNTGHTQASDTIYPIYISQLIRLTPRSVSNFYNTGPLKSVTPGKSHYFTPVPSMRTWWVAACGSQFYGWHSNRRTVSRGVGTLRHRITRG